MIIEATRDTARPVLVPRWVWFWGATVMTLLAGAAALHLRYRGLPNGIVIDTWRNRVCRPAGMCSPVVARPLTALEKLRAFVDSIDTVP